MEKKRRKGGRPFLDENEKQSCYVQARCTKEEQQKIKELANVHNVTLSDYILNSCLNRKLVVHKKELFQEFLKLNNELGMSGSNINQLAKHANRLNKVGDIDQSIINAMVILLEKYNQQVDEMRKAVRKIYKEMANE